MQQKVIELIEYHSEGALVDFKVDQYLLGSNAKKNEILKDISAFANHPSNDDKYIIIGVKEKNGRAEGFKRIENLVDEAKYQEFVSAYLEPKINFEYRGVEYRGYNIAYFRIYNNEDRPYLFKKEAQNTILNKIDYKVGDGYIRMGASSKKIDRTDLEMIYAARTSVRDRKQDLILRPTVNRPKDQELSKLDIKYVDIEIENISNKSISFDVEMKIFKSDSFAIITATDLKKEIDMQQANKSSYIELTPLHVPPIDLFINDSPEALIISRNRMLKKTSMSLPQNFIQPDIFSQFLLVLQNRSNVIRAEVIIRTDDFIEGALVKDLTFIT